MIDFTSVETIYNAVTRRHLFRIEQNGTTRRRFLKTATLRIDRNILPDLDQGVQSIGRPKDAYEILRDIFARLAADREHFILLIINTANDVVGFKLIGSGAQDSTIADPKIIFRNALLLGARQIIIAHNHPSGNPRPSNQDLALTRSLAEVGKVMDLPLLDHIIVTSKGYTSLASTNLECFRVGS